MKRIGRRQFATASLGAAAVDSASQPWQKKTQDLLMVLNIPYEV